MKRKGFALLMTAALVMPLALLPTSHAERNEAPRVNPTGIKGIPARPAPVVQDPQPQSNVISPAILKALGIERQPNDVSPEEAGRRMAQILTGDRNGRITPLTIDGPGNSHAIMAPPSQPEVSGSGSSIVKDANSAPVAPDAAGLPGVLKPNSALSAGLITTLGGINTQLSQVDLLADWDGREDMTADRAATVADFSAALPSPNFTLTRSAISEHTFANGHVFNSYYYGDSLGNLYFGFDLVGNSLVDTVFQVNIPQLVTTGTSSGFTLQNPTASDCADSSAIVTGIAVNPVADLGDFDPALCGQVGEVIYVSTLETVGCASNASGQPIRTRIFAFAVFEIGGTEFVVSQVRQILRTPLADLAGLAVDDDGSLYFPLVDLVTVDPTTGLGGSGGAIFKATELPRTTCTTANRINRAITLIPTVSNVTQAQGTLANPTLSNTFSKVTNYSGPSPVFGNVASLTAGPNNVIYAAVAASNTGVSDPTQGLFKAPFTFPSGLPSMVITFADATGVVNACSSNIPTADGLADPAGAGTTISWRAFVLGNGPDIRTAVAPLSAVGGTPDNTLKIDMQIDYTLYSGISVNEEGSVFVIAGGTPAGVGNNPSPNRTEILGFEDSLQPDRRADYVDFRGNNLPNPPASGGNVGDGDSDRFDHIYYEAPQDPITLTPVGLAGLARGFLRYTNRLAPTAMGTGVTLGSTVGIQGDDSTDGTIIFGNLDPGQQVAGGDDQNPPFRGDDNDGAGTPTVSPGALNGGFEFLFGGPVGVPGSVWNGFFLNSNGNVTFGLGSTDNTATVGELRSGPPRIGAAWADLNPSARAATFGTFPVQALGFANVNTFKVRWINVPEFGSEACTATGGGASNTFSITLADDGVSIDENANQPLNPANPIGNNSVPFDLQEGPTDLRFARLTTPSVLVGGNQRRDGSGNFVNNYGRMDLVGGAGDPVIVGYSIGGLTPADPPGLCETNLSEAARSADVGTFGVVQSQTSNVASGLIGEGTEPTVYEIFNSGSNTAPDFDLRFEGNDAATVTPVGQLDLDRGSVGFFGVGSAPGANPQAIVALADPFVTTPTTSGLINAIGPVTLNIIGVGFYPNEVTTVCGTPGGESPPRPGKTVTTAATLGYDTNGDGTPDAFIVLTAVTPVNSNLIRATIPTAPGLPGSPFPLNANGGRATITVTTTFTAGDNNVFGPFTRTSAFTIDLGVRAPVITSVAPTSGNCGGPQTLAITGGDFQFTQVPASGPNLNATVSDVFAQELGNPGNVIHATAFTVLDSTHLSATFTFGSSAGKTFLIFAVGTGGTSRNLLTLPPGSPGGVPIGNEAGNLITFSCGQTFELVTQNYSVGEGSPRVDITVTRFGDTSSAASVGYATSDTAALQNCNVFNGIASSRCDYEITIGTLQFAAGETSKSFSVAIIDDSYAEGNETFTASLNNASGASIGALSSTVVTIVDNDVTTGPNPIDNTDFFVRQQYLDFLGREPDPAGFTGWVNTINTCSGNTTLCDRVHVSQLFFQSLEFQNRGYFVYRFYPVSFGRKPDFAEFVVDMARLSGFLTDAQLEAAKTSFIAEFMARPAFVAAYNFPSNPTGNQQYVDKLIQTAGVTLPQRQTLIDGLNNATLTRAQVLRQIVESSEVFAKYLNQAFAVMEYFGYLRRDPDALYLNYILMLDQGADPRTMVSNFVNSTEYRMRFGPP